MATLQETYDAPFFRKVEKQDLIEGHTDLEMYRATIIVPEEYKKMIESLVQWAEERGLSTRPMEAVLTAIGYCYGDMLRSGAIHSNTLQYGTN